MHAVVTVRKHGASNTHTLRSIKDNRAQCVMRRSERAVSCLPQNIRHISRDTRRRHKGRVYDKQLLTHYEHQLT
jgi:hypothetical protein